MPFVEINEEESISGKGRFEEIGEEQIPGYRSVIKGVSKAVTSLPTFTGPISGKAQEELLEKQFPTPDTGLYPYAESIAEGAAEGAKFGPLGAIPGAIGGGLKEFAKQKDAPEWVQTLADIAPWLFSKKGLIPKKNQKEVVEFLRGKGFSDKEITPLIQGKAKLSVLSKLGKRGARVEERLENIKDKFQKSYDVFRAKGKDLPLSRNKVSSFMKKFDEVWEDIPADQKKIMEPLVEEFKSKPVTRATQQDLFHGINRQIYGKGKVGSKEILNKLKDPLYEGMELTSPGSGKDFKLLNELNAKKFEVMKKLAPNQLDRLASLLEFAGIARAIGTGNFKEAAVIVGEAGTRKLMTEFLINPHLQNISKRMIEALAKNKVPIAEKLEKKVKQEIKRTLPDIYKKLFKENNDREKGKQQT